MAATPCIALAAGEASGDQLGAALIRAVRERRPDVRFAGVAGPAMRAAGCDPWFRTEDLSVMGLAEIVRHLPRLLRMRSGLKARLLAERPAVFVGIDAPDFNLPVAAAVRAAGIPTVQYVCPSVWAWRRGRVRGLRRACDRVLCLLPFEAPFLQGAGVAATFVGHPFADQIPEVTPAEPARLQLGIGAQTVIGLLPGSRSSEIELLGPVFLAAARELAGRFPRAAFVAPMASSTVHARFQSLVAHHAPDLDLLLVDGRAREAIAASDIVLVASGTATLETLLVGRPMVVAYRLAPLTYWLARSLNLVKVRYFSLPNLLADAPLVPELLQQQVTASGLAAAAAGLLERAGQRQELMTRFAAIGRSLRRGASDGAARAVLEVARLD